MLRATGLAIVLLASACSDDVDDSVAPPTTTSIPTTPTDSDGRPVEVPDQLIGARPLGIGDELFATLGNPGYDVQHYTLDLDFDPEPRLLQGVANIEAMATADLDMVNLDFAQLETHSAQIDGADATFVTIAEDLIIATPDTIRAGTQFSVQVEYSGTPGLNPSPAAPIGDIGWFASDSGEHHFVLAQPDAAHDWYPVNDHPLDKATYTFNIAVPQGVTAAANGVLVDTTTDNGRTTWRWAMSSPMASHLATVVIGPFTIVEDPEATAEAGVLIRHVLPEGDTAADWPGLERSGEMLSFFAERFGPYPFEAYGVAMVDAQLGVALETQTLSIVDSSLASSPELFEEIMTHELAHQWYGNSVALEQWSDIWLSEGFATYSTWLWLDAEGAIDIDARTDDLRRFWSTVDAPPIGDPTVGDMFSGPSYEIGALTLHALRRTIGDDAFFDLLREYSDRFGGSTAYADEFAALASEMSGQDLTDFFDSWLHGPSLPELPTTG